MCESKITALPQSRFIGLGNILITLQSGARKRNYQILQRVRDASVI